MLINLKERLQEPAVQELLGYSVYPDPEQLERTLDQYRTLESLELYGLESDGELIGLVGFEMDEEGHLQIRHLSVHPEERGKGFGRGLLLELIERKDPAVLTAETDDEAVDFYRNVGFEVTSLGETYPGTERFRCIYEAKPEE